MYYYVKALKCECSAKIYEYLIKVCPEYINPLL